MQNTTSTKQQDSPTKQPTDTGSVSVDAFVKIFDPKTRKVFVEQKS
jgi:hypothetical protein